MARVRVDARLSVMATIPAGGSAANDRAAAMEDIRRCPDSLLVRAIEALGRVYMHREAALVGDVGILQGRGEVGEFDGIWGGKGS